MSYKQEDLKAAIIRALSKDPNQVAGASHYLKAAGIERACKEIAIMHFVHQYSEDVDTKLVRQALLDLEIKARFDYE